MTVTLEMPRKDLLKILEKVDDRLEVILQEDISNRLESASILQHSSTYPAIKRCLANSPYQYTSGTDY